MARKTVALLTTAMEHEYTNGIADGVRSSLAKRGYDLMLVSSTAQGFERLRPDHLRMGFLAARDADFDAYIVLAGILRHRAREARMNVDALFGLLPREKTLILEDHVPGFRCLYKNNVPGMREVMRHVIEDCDCERVGFVSGPVTSYGAREREAVYREEMAAHDLPIQERWFARGLFRGGPQDLIDEYVTRNQDLQAIVCATDPLALNVYHALEKLHLRPGIDVLVTGHDDQPCASVAQPPLTTVQLDPFDFGYKAGNEAANIVEGLEQGQETIGGSLVERESCGEKPSNSRIAFDQLVSMVPFPTDKIALELLARCAKESVVREDSPHLEDLVAMVDMAHELCSGFGSRVDVAQFLAADRIGRFAEAANRGELRMDLLQAVLDDYLWALMCHAPERSQTELTRLLLKTDQSFVRYVNARHQQSVQTVLAREIAMSRIVDAGVLATDHDDLMAQLLRGLAAAGVREGSLFLCEEPVPIEGRKFELPETMRLAGELHAGLPKVVAGDEAHGAGAGEQSIAELLARSGKRIGDASDDDAAAPSTWGFVPLYRGRKLFGLLVAELTEMGLPQLHTLSLSVTRALGNWDARKQ